MKNFSGTQIRTNIRPGDLGSIIHLHGYFFHQECGFGDTFEPYVAVSLAEFIRAKKERQRLWVVDYRNRIAGSLAVVEHSRNLAHLRWFLLHPRIRGKGIGGYLLREALAFCRVCDYEQAFVWTLDYLEASKKLYEKCGLQLTEERKNTIWGIEMNEQRYALSL
jgi:GNAT superfamily N-acetyltransferase